MNMQPEYQLLLCCTRTKLSKNNQDKMINTLSLLWKAVFPPLEWLTVYYDRPREKKLYLPHLINLSTILLVGIRDILNFSGKKSI